MPAQGADVVDESSGAGRVFVVGGGVIGLSCAWRLARAGHHVSVVDAAPCSGASWVAGGMLAPITEAWPGEERLLELGSESLRRWPAFAAELEGAGLDEAKLDGTGLDGAGSGRSGLRTEGTLAVAVDAADREELEALAAHLAHLGREVSWLDRRELRALEQGLGPAVRGGLSVPGDLAVDNRALLDALRAALVGAHVEFVPHAAVNVRPAVVELADGRTINGDVVVLAAGAWSAALHPALRGRLRPVKGEIVRLRARGTALPPPERTVRAQVRGRPVYLVPRDGGRLVLGATQYEAGFDTAVTVAGVRDLLCDAEVVLPGITEYEIEEISAGLRPSSHDNLPIIEWLEPGLLAATGHGRNGILLAPVTADAVLALIERELDGQPRPDLLEVSDEVAAQRH
jgi:glycine oxidase